VHILHILLDTTTYEPYIRKAKEDRALSKPWLRHGHDATTLQSQPQLPHPPVLAEIGSRPFSRRVPGPLHTERAFCYKTQLPKQEEP
jgi:hypothetical protein